MKLFKPMKIADIVPGATGAPAVGGEGGGAPVGDDRKTDLEFLDDIDDDTPPATKIGDDDDDEDDDVDPGKKKTPPAKAEDDDDLEDEDDDDLTDEEKAAKQAAKDKKKGADDDDDADDDVEEDAEIVNRPSPRAIKEKFPTFFKEFPELRHVIFREQAFSEHFTSVEEAKETVAKVADFAVVEESVGEGKSGYILSLLVKNKPESLEAFVTDFLPTVWEGDKELYAKAVNPILINFIRQVAKYGEEMGGDIGKSNVAAARYFSKYLTGKSEIPVVPSKPQNDPAMDRVRVREQAIAEREYKSFETKVMSRSDKALIREIRRGIDPKNEMKDYVREALQDKVFKDVNAALKKDPAYLRRMQNLWKMAHRGGYGSDHESQIVSAYLGRARQILPAIRLKAQQDALPRQTANGDVKVGKELPLKKQVPPGGGQTGRSEGRTPIDSKRINYGKTTDMDILNGKAVLKK